MANDKFRGKRSSFKNFEELYTAISPKGLKPPHSDAIEATVLGSMLLPNNNKTTVSTCIEVLGKTDDDEPSPFFREKHTAIYRAMLSLDERQSPIDVVTVMAELKAKGVLEEIGGPAYLVMMLESVVTTANVESHCRLLMEYLIRRELMRNGEEQKLLANDMSADVFDAIETADVSLYKLNSIRFKTSFATMPQISDMVMDRLVHLAQRNEDVTGIASELQDLDAMTNGWQDTDLIVLAARPSQGKSALADNSFARNAALGQKRIATAIFSLEMGKESVYKRIVCSDAGVDLHQLNKSRLLPEEWKRYKISDEKIRNAPIFIDDTPGITPQELRAKARRLKQKEGIGLIIVDYLQLMEVSKQMDSREREISVISRSLKALARELKVPVIALSQLSRNVESRQDKKPMLSDLRESGAIEQDADVVLFIYRPETYGIDKFFDQKPTAGIAEIIIGKQRNGPIGSIRVKFDSKCGDFEDVAPFFPDFTD